MAYVFSITNRQTGMRYIGCTILNPYKRLKTLMGGSSKRPITKAMKDSGIEAFTTSVLEVCDNEDRFDRAAHWIKELNTVWPNGYNKRVDDVHNRAKVDKRRHK